jgi:hypothetical protein
MEFVAAEGAYCVCVCRLNPRAKTDAKVAPTAMQATRMMVVVIFQVLVLVYLYLAYYVIRIIG